MEIFVGAEALLGIFAYIFGNEPSFTDEGVGAELQQLDTTSVDAAKI